MAKKKRFIESPEKLEEFIRSIVKKAGYKFIKLELRPMGRAKQLVITADKEGGGISAEDCAVISRKVEAEFDRYNFIPEKYFLIVSSPGID